MAGAPGVLPDCGPVGEAGCPDGFVPGFVPGFVLGLPVGRVPGPLPLSFPKTTSEQV